MSVYHADNPIFFDTALQSLVTNTIKPTEIVLVCDGELTEDLEQIIYNYRNKLTINLIRLDKNVGLGLSLQAGLTKCQHEWIARFDADDVCCNNRFEKQIEFIKKNPYIDVFGGQIIEFNVSPKETTIVKKRVPYKQHIIQKYAKSRNPINHMTVMFRKSAVLAAGNYHDNYLYEDYELWVRMLLNGYKFANIDAVLVYARTGKAMYRRRGGLSYAKQEIKMQYRFFKLGFLNWGQFLRNLIIRIPIRLVPNSIRGLVYLVFLRR